MSFNKKQLKNESKIVAIVDRWSFFTDIFYMLIAGLTNSGRCKHVVAIWRRSYTFMHYRYLKTKSLLKLK
jgi:hypothetical protein